MRGDLWVADRDGSHRSLLVRGADQPAWGPNGRRIAFVRGGSVWTVRADGLDERRLARGAHPDWSPDGSRLAFDRDGETYTARWWYGGAQKDAGLGTDPAYAPDGRLAVVRDGQIYVGGNAVATGHVARLVARRTARVGSRRRHLRGRQALPPRHAARVAPGAAVARAATRLRPARAERTRDRRRSGRLAARLHVARRQSRPRQLRARRRPAARRLAHDRHAARAARERQHARLPGRRRVPVHELATAPPLAPDALRLVRAAHARRPDTRPRPQERLLPRRPLGRRAGLLSRPPSGLPRRLRAVPSGGDER